MERIMLSLVLMIVMAGNLAAQKFTEPAQSFSVSGKPAAPTTEVLRREPSGKVLLMTTSPPTLLGVMKPAPEPPTAGLSGALTVRLSGTLEPEPAQGSGYIYIASLTSNETLVTKATVAVAKSASYVLAGGGSPCVERSANARAALDNPRQEAVAHFMWLIALDSTIQGVGANATDANVQQVIDTFFVSIWGTCS